MGSAANPGVCPGRGNQFRAHLLAILRGENRDVIHLPASFAGLSSFASCNWRIPNDSDQDDVALGCSTGEGGPYSAFFGLAQLGDDGEIFERGGVALDLAV